MPTAKRERKRAGRQARLAAEEAARRRRARRRQTIILAVVAAIVIAVVVAIGQTSSKTSHSKSSASPAGATPKCPNPNGSSPKTQSFSGPPPTCINLADNYSATVNTDAGPFAISLDAKQAPKAVNNFVFLARYHYYDGVIFHRVIPGFVVQGGDPSGTGSGPDPGYKFADELPKAGSYKIGSVAMANSGPNTNGSQFFIVTGPQGEQLPPNYSLFGQVTSGMPVVSRIEADGSSSGTPKVTHRMESVTITETPA